jgi:hypothetical protein
MAIPPGFAKYPYQAAAIVWRFVGVYLSIYVCVYIDVYVYILY